MRGHTEQNAWAAHFRWALFYIRSLSCTLQICTLCVCWTVIKKVNTHSSFPKVLWINHSILTHTHTRTQNQLFSWNFFSNGITQGSKCLRECPAWGPQNTAGSCVCHFSPGAYVRAITTSRRTVRDDLPRALGLGVPPLVRGHRAPVQSRDLGVPPPTVLLPWVWRTHKMVFKKGLTVILGGNDLCVEKQLLRHAE